jgi:hypothetical protein
MIWIYTLFLGNFWPHHLLAQVRQIFADLQARFARRIVRGYFKRIQRVEYYRLTLKKQFMIVGIAVVALGKPTESPSIGYSQKTEGSS